MKKSQARLAFLDIMINQQINSLKKRYVPFKKLERTGKKHY